jgi:hypothetical protein
MSSRSNSGGLPFAQRMNPRSSIHSPFDLDQEVPQGFAPPMLVTLRDPLESAWETSVTDRMAYKKRIEPEVRMRGMGFEPTDPFGSGS